MSDRQDEEHQVTKPSSDEDDLSTFLLNRLELQERELDIDKFFRGAGEAGR